MVKPRTWYRSFVVGVLLAIGVFDVVSGLRMLLGAQPWMQNWQEGRWLALPAPLRNDPALMPFLLGLYRRIGALWLHAGLVTLCWVGFARKSWTGLAVLLGTYTLSGLGIAYCDHVFAAGTHWLVLKQVVGGLWVAALVVHALDRPRRTT